MKFVDVLDRRGVFRFRLSKKASLVTTTCARVFVNYFLSASMYIYILYIHRGREKIIHKNASARGND